MNITRGDTKSFKFRRKSDGKPITQEADNIYFTVKNTNYTDEVLFQKTIDDMDFDEEYYYHFTILPKDTNELEYGDYKYDIEVKIGDTYVKTIAKGTLKIEEETTFMVNEV